MSKSKEKDSTLKLIEQCSAKDIRNWRALGKRLDWFHISSFYYFATQRSYLADDINAALLGGTVEFSIKNFFRVTALRWASHPLSAAGSVANRLGGRFNIGSLAPDRFPPFPALYIAESLDTALIESLGPRDARSANFDYSLMTGGSYCSVRIIGEVERLFELNPSNLRPFLEVIARIKDSSQLKNMARKLKVSPMHAIKTPSVLHRTLKDPNWRLWPTALNVPANSQIFGQILRAAGIQGIAYPSASNGKRCIALFPENFSDTGSFLRLKDPASAECVHKELNSITFRNFC